MNYKTIAVNRDSFIHKLSLILMLTLVLKGKLLPILFGPYAYHVEQFFIDAYFGALN